MLSPLWFIIIPMKPYSIISIIAYQLWRFEWFTWASYHRYVDTTHASQEVHGHFPAATAPIDGAGAGDDVGEGGGNQQAYPMAQLGLITAGGYTYSEWV